VTNVDPRSNAADKRIQPGEVIVEINQEPVAQPADIAKKLKALKESGKKSALLLVAGLQGDVHFVALPIE
jgi:serine protease Do